MIIGIYDSGLGGLSVWRELRSLVNAKLIYFGDTAHMPYGEKTLTQLQAYFWDIFHFFERKKAQAVVMACNTSSAVVLPRVKGIAPLPVIGIIDAALRAILPVSLGRVGLLATTVTVESGVYQRRLHQLRPDWEITAQSAPALVPLVEDGKVAGAEVRSALSLYLTPLLAKKVDTLLLGCTHYPFLKQGITQIVGKDLKIVDPAQALALEVRDELKIHDFSYSRSVSEFWVSAEPVKFQKTAEKLLGEEITQVKMHQLPGVKA